MLRVGDKIDSFTLIKELGKGGFGVVWLAEERTIFAAPKVALKIALEEKINLEAIKQEAKLWVQASGHINVLPIFGVRICNEQVVIISEYAPDGSLEEWLNEHGGKAPSIEATVDIVYGIVAGLEHLHAKGIIHRDLKPANILLQGETPRLADFGLARLLKSSQQSMNVGGTLPYMAPEVFSGERSEQTDVWAAGVIFYQLLVGRLPFPQQDIRSLINAIDTHDPTLPSSIPTVLQKIINKSLQRNSALRYKSATEMRLALRDARRTLPYNDISQREEDAQQLIITNATEGKQQDEESSGIAPTVAMASSAKDLTLPPTNANPAPTEKAQEQEAQPLPQHVAGAPPAYVSQESNHKIVLPSAPAPAQAPTSALPSLTTPMQSIQNSRRSAWVIAGVVALLVVSTIIFFIITTYNKVDVAPENSNLPNAQPTATQPVETVMQHQQAAETFAQQQKWKEAEAEWRQAVRLDPGNVMLYDGLTYALLRQLKFTEEATAAREAIRLDPNNPKWHNRLGGALHEQLRMRGNQQETALKPALKEYAKAEQLARESLKVSPNDVSYLKELGDGLTYQGKRVEAEQLFRQAINLKPEDAELHHSLARNLMNQQKYAEAETEFRVALRFKPGDAQIALNLGASLMRQEKYAEAEAAIKESVQAEPDVALYHNQLAIALTYQRKYDEAEAEMKEAVRLDPASNYHKLGLKTIEATKKKYPNVSIP